MTETTIEKSAAKERLEKFLRENNVPIAHSVEELYRHSIKDDDGEEIDEFIRMREEWRKENRERSID